MYIKREIVLVLNHVLLKNAIMKKEKKKEKEKK